MKNQRVPKVTMGCFFLAAITAARIAARMIRETMTLGSEKCRLTEKGLSMEREVGQSHSRM
ncbi:hypothetical protein BMS3Abin14_00931 [bacterium BMS3Abin14]|nr:hypothetical protein BMS3Abin14_00931 [bacterium BMS3Abin14]